MSQENQIGKRKYHYQNEDVNKLMRGSQETQPQNQEAANFDDVIPTQILANSITSKQKSLQQVQQQQYTQFQSDQINDCVKFPDTEQLIASQNHQQEQQNRFLQEQQVQRQTQQQQEQPQQSNKQSHKEINNHNIMDNQQDNSSTDLRILQDSIPTQIVESSENKFQTQQWAQQYQLQNTSSSQGHQTTSIQDPQSVLVQMSQDQQQSQMGYIQQKQEYSQRFIENPQVQQQQQLNRQIQSKQNIEAQSNIQYINDSQSHSVDNRYTEPLVAFTQRIIEETQIDIDDKENIGCKSNVNILQQQQQEGDISQSKQDGICNPNAFKDSSQQLNQQIRQNPNGVYKENIGCNNYVQVSQQQQQGDISLSKQDGTCNPNIFKDSSQQLNLSNKQNPNGLSQEKFVQPNQNHIQSQYSRSKDQESQYNQQVQQPLQYEYQQQTQSQNSWEMRESQPQNSELNQNILKQNLKVDYEGLIPCQDHLFLQNQKQQTQLIQDDSSLYTQQPKLPLSPYSALGQQNDNQGSRLGQGQDSFDFGEQPLKNRATIINVQDNQFWCPELNEQSIENNNGSNSRQQSIDNERYEKGPVQTIDPQNIFYGSLDNHNKRNNLQMFSDSNNNNRFSNGSNMDSHLNETESQQENQDRLAGCQIQFNGQNTIHNVNADEVSVSKHEGVSIDDHGKPLANQNVDIYNQIQISSDLEQHDDEQQNRSFYKEQNTHYDQNQKDNQDTDKDFIQKGNSQDLQKQKKYFSNEIIDRQNSDIKSVDMVMDNIESIDTNNTIRYQNHKKFKNQNQIGAIDSYQDYISRKQQSPSKLITDIEGEYMSVTSKDGKRVYCSIQEQQVNYKSIAQSFQKQAQQDKSQQKSSPFSELLHEVRTEYMDKMVKTQSLQINQEKRNQPLQFVRQKDGQVVVKKKCCSLWVDKYSPRRYIDLLSEEPLNREVMTWFKLWDQCVFKRQNVVKTSDLDKFKGRFSQYNNFSAKNNSSNNSNNYQNKNFGKDCADEDNLDAFGRPYRKILLLWGNPGIGKTTLAHIGAKSCGYQPFEINASDDRSNQNLIQKVKDLVSSTTLQKGKQMPQCVIIDEIDGAMGGSDGKNAITSLIKLVNVETNPKSNKDDEKTQAQIGKKGSKKKSSAPLLRPIICICNDIFSPHLKPLRDISYVLNCKPPQTGQLMGRIKSICSLENLQVDHQALMHVCQENEADIRGVLNLLQFLSKDKNRIKLDHIQGKDFSRKDHQQSIYDVWNLSFKGRIKKSNAPQMQMNKDICQCFQVFEAAQKCGENDLALQGLFENYPTQVQGPSAFQKSITFLEKLSDVDYYVNVANNGSKYFNDCEYLLCPLLPSYCHTLFAATSSCPTAVKWPYIFQQYSRQQQNMTNLLRQWWHLMNPWQTSCFTSLVVSSLTVPYLLTILDKQCAKLRAVAKNVLKQDELQTLQNAVSIMLQHGLSIDQYSEAHKKYTSNGKHLKMPLDPPLQNLHAYSHGLYQDQFDPKVSYQIQQQIERLQQQKAFEKGINISGGVIQTIVQELDLQQASKFKGNDTQEEKEGGQGQFFRGQNVQQVQQSSNVRMMPQSLCGGGKRKSSDQKEPVQVQNGTKKMRSLAQWLKPQSNVNSDNINEINGSYKNQTNSKKWDQKKQDLVVYKYNEGLTNAIKKPIKINEFL